MTARPILFRDDMVRAILDGRKDVTRRVGSIWVNAKAGDLLWGREAHCSADMGPLREGGPVAYRADYPVDDGVRRGPWRPGIHMPRWACRLTLDVVSVTEQLGADTGDGERLLPDLDDAEAVREGFANRRAFLSAWLSMHPDHLGPVYRIEFVPRRAA